MIDWATDFIDSIGVVGVALLVALENIFPPIPSELILLLTGFNVSQGRFGYVGGVVFATAGSVGGALVLYGFGRWLNEERLEWLLAGVGRFAGFKRRDIDKGFDWFERHGTLVVFFGRLVPIVRSVVSIPAGADKMPIGKFCLLTAAGSTVWNAIWVAVGWGLGDRWEDAGVWGDRVQYATIAIGAVVFVWLVVRTRRNRAVEPV